MNENEDSNSPYLKSRLDDLKNEETAKRIINETYEDLKNNSKYKEYFEQYRPDSIEEFIKSYSQQKGNCWLRHGEMYLKLENDAHNWFRVEADKCLWEIQQKKLFNLQCLWRAEKIQLEGVE